MEVKDKLITAEGLKYAYDNLSDDIDSLIEVSENAPTNENNQMWIGGAEETIEIPTMDEVAGKMERYVIRLVKVGNSYKLTSLEDDDLTFNDVYEVTRKLNEYVVVVYGSSKLRPQYVSTNEIMFVGLDRSTDTKVLRILLTPSRLTYETFKLAEYSDLTNAGIDAAEIEANKVAAEAAATAATTAKNAAVSAATEAQTLVDNAQATMEGVIAGAAGTIVVDPTLALTGAAADAKATGDKITSLTADLTDMEKRLKSGKIEDAELHLGFYLDDNGDLCQED